MTKLAPEWVRTSDPMIRSPARYRWTAAPAGWREGPGGGGGGGQLNSNLSKRQCKLTHTSYMVSVYCTHVSVFPAYLVLVVYNHHRFPHTQVAIVSFSVS